jgi:hypothetical protein
MVVMISRPMDNKPMLMLMLMLMTEKTRVL